MLSYKVIALVTIGMWVALSFSQAVAQQPTPTLTLQSPAPVIFSPSPGQALQGIFSVIGSTDIVDFQSAELQFTYQNNPTDTWFLISQIYQPMSNEVLAQWDTTTITDGNYTLRLVVTLKDGSVRITTVPDLRVRNYTPIETDTPTPTIATKPTQDQSELATPTPTSTPPISVTTPTPLPPNPAQLDQQELMIYAGKGALITLGLFALGIIYQAVRSSSRKK